MWLMTKHGFYSIVQRSPDLFHVRARERQDLENLINRVPLPDARIVETREADYAYRLIADHKTVLAILDFLGTTVDYPNFKDRIHATPDQRHKPYNRVWQVMADALGAYGSKHQGKTSQ